MTQRVGMKKGGNKNQEKSGNNNNVGFGFAWTHLWKLLISRYNEITYYMLKKYYLKSK